VEKKFGEGIGSANPENLREHVKILSESNPPRNFAHPQSLDKTAEYIAKKFEESGLVPQMQEFKVGKETYRNVIVRLGPDTGEYLVIGAHYDVCDDLPGADDNASGTAGLLELARLLGSLKDKLKRPVELVAYTLEEPPNFRSKNMGSYIPAQSMRLANKNIKLMISLEMIGYFRNEMWSQKYPISAFYLLYPWVGNFINLIARPQEWGVMREVKSIFVAATDLPVRSANIPRIVRGMDFSDHLSYWSLDFPAMMITDTSFMRNQNYHRAEDLPETLDYRRMAEVVNGVAAIAVGL
jgi:Zn-dependent M28 family amino/carboxypeptidase